MLRQKHYRNKYNHALSATIGEHLENKPTIDLPRNPKPQTYTQTKQKSSATLIARLVAEIGFVVARRNAHIELLPGNPLCIAILDGKRLTGFFEVSPSLIKRLGFELPPKRDLAAEWLWEQDRCDAKIN